jgi:hypothetical protein
VGPSAIPRQRQSEKLGSRSRFTNSQQNGQKTNPITVNQAPQVHSEVHEIRFATAFTGCGSRLLSVNLGGVNFWV